jgi:glucose-6-phosphate isomerase
MPEVFHNYEDIAVVDQTWIDHLKRVASESPLRRARLCLHRGNDEPVQEMIIALCRDVLLRPHRHVRKSESFHVIDGEMYLLIFDDSGKILRAVHMGPPGSGRTFCYRLCVSAWHGVLPRSEHVVFHETTDGPFQPSNPSQFAPWAPTEPERLREFLEVSLRQTFAS